MHRVAIEQSSTILARPKSLCNIVRAPNSHCKAPARTFRAAVKSSAHTNGANAEEKAEGSNQERFISVSDLLNEVISVDIYGCRTPVSALSLAASNKLLCHQVKNLGDDFVFEDKDEATEVWGHEQRLRAQQSAGVWLLSCASLPLLYLLNLQIFRAWCCRGCTF